MFFSFEQIRAEKSKLMVVLEGNEVTKSLGLNDEKMSMQVSGKIREFRFSNHDLLSRIKGKRRNKIWLKKFFLFPIFSLVLDCTGAASAVSQGMILVTRPYRF